MNLVLRETTTMSMKKFNQLMASFCSYTKLAFKVTIAAIVDKIANLLLSSVLKGLTYLSSLSLTIMIHNENPILYELENKNEMTMNTFLREFTNSQ